MILNWFLVVSSFCAASLLHTDRELLFTPRVVSSSDYLKNRLFPPSLSKKLEDRKTFRTIKFLRLLPSRQAEGIIGMCLVSVCVSPLDDYRWFKQVPVADPRFRGRGDAGLKLTLWNAQLLMFPAKLSLFLLWKTSSTEPGGKIPWVMYQDYMDLICLNKKDALLGCTAENSKTNNDFDFNILLLIAY